jgi:integrase
MCMHINDTLDLEGVVKAISHMSTRELDGLQAAIDQRRADEKQTVVAERRAYGGGLLQREHHRNGSNRETQGPRRRDKAAGYRAGEERLKAAASWEDNDLIFPTRKGALLRPSTVTDDHFKTLLERVGLPRSVRFHDLRHTATTLLLGRGVHPNLVQELLGHSSIAITLDRYSHWIPSMGEQTAAIEAALS